MHTVPNMRTLPALARFPFGAPTPAVGSTPTGTAVVTALDAKTTKQGKPYSRLTLRNATGDTIVNVWSESLPLLADIAVGAPVSITMTRVAGRDSTDEWQFTDIERLPANHAVAREAMPMCPVPRTLLTARTTRILDTLSAEARDLFDRIMRTPMRGADGTHAPLLVAFVEAPAAVGHHHAHLGGLWWHSLQVTEGAEASALAYRESGDAPDIDLDAVRLGGMLHDLGKVVEYFWSGTIAMAPLSGSMSHMGHGLRLITEALTRAEVEHGWTPTTRQRELAEHVQHVVASHHMQREWGAIAEPASREAWCVQSADLLSSRIQPITDAVATITDRRDGWLVVQDGWRKKILFASPTAGTSAASPPADDTGPATDPLLTFTLDAIAPEA